MCPPGSREHTAAACIAERIAAEVGQVTLIYSAFPWSVHSPS
jgi:hypothetical protein